MTSDLDIYRCACNSRRLGGIAQILYCSTGAKNMPKEHVEVFCGGHSAVIDGFRTAYLYRGDTSVRKERLAAQDKGQKAMLEAWVEGLRSGKPAVEPEVLINSSLATILAAESLMLDMPLSVDAAAVLMEGDGDENGAA